MNSLEPGSSQALAIEERTKSLIKEAGGARKLIFTTLQTDDGAVLSEENRKALKLGGAIKVPGRVADSLDGLRRLTMEG